MLTKLFSPPASRQRLSANYFAVGVRAEDVTKCQMRSLFILSIPSLVFPNLEPSLVEFSHCHRAYQAVLEFFIGGTYFIDFFAVCKKGKNKQIKKRIHILKTFFFH